MPQQENRDSNGVQLTRKERELLDLLENNPGRCFSRGFLLKTVWGYGDDTRTRTVDVHVSRLRKKLGYRRDIAIHTVVRQGYVLEKLGEPALGSFSAKAATAFSTAAALAAV